MKFNHFLLIFCFVVMGTGNNVFSKQLNEDEQSYEDNGTQTLGYIACGNQAGKISHFVCGEEPDNNNKKLPKCSEKSGKKVCKKQKMTYLDFYEQ